MSDWVICGLVILYIMVGIFFSMIFCEDDAVGECFMIVFWPLVIAAIIFVIVVFGIPYCLAQMVKRWLDDVSDM